MLLIKYLLPPLPMNDELTIKDTLRVIATGALFVLIAMLAITGFLVFIWAAEWIQFYISKLPTP